MKTVIIVSRCISVSAKKTAKFHFKGVAAGEMIKDIKLSFDDTFSPVAGTEYAMYVRIEEVKKGVLIGKILKAKDLTKTFKVKTGASI